MTTEEKAKAYDEALKKIQPLYEQAKKDYNPIWSTYEHLFPELRESEDERMRRKTINCLTMHNKGCVDAKDIDECIAWLEKQKEPKPAEWSEKDERTLTHIQSHLKYLTEHRFEIKDYNTMEDRMILESEIEWLKNRFKSLRPHWKPSEEQMEALAYASKVLSSALYPVAAKASEELESIREQLKKL